MKNFHAVLLTLVCLLVQSVSAQTNVSGFINANTTWTTAGSPYIVTGNALLSQGYTLTIDPGVVVKFDSNKALQIDGQLIAIGTPSQRIVFTSNQSSPQPGDWAKLHFSDFSTDAVYDAAGNYVSGCILKYCDVDYAGSAMYGALDIQSSSPYINHCRILYCSWSGINFNGEHLTVDSSAIRNSGARGIYYMGGHFLMRNDTFFANAQGAIHIQQSGDSIQSRIEDSYFRQNDYCITWQNNWLQRVTIKGNSFVNNTGEIIQLQGSNDTVSCNHFSGNNGGPVIHWGDASNPASDGVIYNNVIEYNVNNSGPSVFMIGSGIYSDDTLYISNNMIRHNSSPGNSCCQIEPYLFTGTTRFLQIYDNIFTENDGMSFMRMDGNQTNNPSLDFLYMQHNTFMNPQCQYELYNNVPYGSPNLFLYNNYWGTNNTSYIDGVIYDYFDFANQSVVYYSPILVSPVVIDTSCQPFHLPMGIRDESIFLNSSAALYPNPTNGEFTIRFNDPSKPFAGIIEILNPLSEVIYRSEISSSVNTVFTLPEQSGVYIVRLISEDVTSVAKIVKQ